MIAFMIMDPTRVDGIPAAGPSPSQWPRLGLTVTGTDSDDARARGIPSRVPARPDSGGHSEPAASEPGPLASEAGRLSDLSLPVSDSDSESEAAG